MTLSACIGSAVKSVADCPNRVKFEPPDGRVIHGLGQYVPFFYTEEENWKYVNEYREATGKTPLVYAVYVFLDPEADEYKQPNISEILNSSGTDYILNIGIILKSMHSLKNGKNDVASDKILKGDWDFRIVELAGIIKNIGQPVYLRPGFEFGSENSGFHSDPNLKPEEFKAIWSKLFNIFKENGTNNVAWVWNTVNPFVFDYMQWYPGDAYVDWWGINYFTLEQMKSSDHFLINAKKHNKPVMVCESSPIHNDGSANFKNWNDWYKPLFDKIAAYTQIKGFIYISDPWEKPGFWHDWADSRINNHSTDPEVRKNYMIEINGKQYIHLDEYLKDETIIMAGQS